MIEGMNRAESTWWNMPLSLSLSLSPSPSLKIYTNKTPLTLKMMIEVVNSTEWNCGNVSLPHPYPLSPLVLSLPTPQPPAPSLSLSQYTLRKAHLTPKIMIKGVKSAESTLFKQASLSHGLIEFIWYSIWWLNIWIVLSQCCGKRCSGFRTPSYAMFLSYAMFFKGLKSSLRNSHMIY